MLVMHDAIFVIMWMVLAFYELCYITKLYQQLKNEKHNFQWIIKTSQYRCRNSSHSSSYPLMPPNINVMMLIYLSTLVLFKQRTFFAFSFSVMGDRNNERMNSENKKKKRKTLKLIKVANKWRLNWWYKYIRQMKAS